MARDFFINGESLVLVKGRQDQSVLASLQQLGLSDDRIRVSFQTKHRDLTVDAWGEAPPDVQWKNTTGTVSMTLIHFDPTVLEACLLESFAGNGTGLGRAGQRMGNNQPRFGPGGAGGNHYIGLNIVSPVAAVPWRFYFAYLAEQPLEWPLGTEKSIVQLNWRIIPYTQDPYGNGLGSSNTPFYDHTLDT